uniref:Uncharacterized protein n=1 Tax=Arundo donax TaxID=35708 RepID=A0A0A9HC68_ARUDO
MSPPAPSASTTERHLPSDAGRRCPKIWFASSRPACWPATCWTTSASEPSAPADGPAPPPPAAAAAASPTRASTRAAG